MFQRFKKAIRVLKTFRVSLFQFISRHFARPKIGCTSIANEQQQTIGQSAPAGSQKLSLADRSHFSGQRPSSAQGCTPTTL